ncbi:hypothetical protein SAMN06264364_11086 [Quadrisphaera granulorum]|uniref:DoxX-like protein n=2 Tax=Quadrisphaera granulorum TaxID=317664 RepID=A0A316A899_9ACTN|nr:hypothetical protein [Quadrisphaera granulorum]PWJ53843.1 hypothetical protein BXY45_11086 [Quadrisphaera granulorum]SZE96600.1 hypothetical protein SAMN06264364_11086 [Quadrisphaera granulorum]
MRMSHLPARIASGAYILNSGLSKRNASPETAAGLHGFATTAYPFLQQVEAQKFVKALSTAEIALGAALLVPFVPTRLAAAGLAAFSGGLLGLYLRVPGMREPGSLRWTEQGQAIAKDVFLAGIAGTLLADTDRRAKDAS